MYPEFIRTVSFIGAKYSEYVVRYPRTCKPPLYHVLLGSFISTSTTEKNTHSLADSSNLHGQMKLQVILSQTCHCDDLDLKLSYVTWLQWLDTAEWSSPRLSVAPRSDGSLPGPLHQGRPSSSSPSYRVLNTPHHSGIIHPGNIQSAFIVREGS